MKLGREIALSVDLMFGKPENKGSCIQIDYGYYLSTKMEVIHEFVRQLLEYSFQVMKIIINDKVMMAGQNSKSITKRTLYGLITH